MHCLSCPNSQGHTNVSTPNEEVHQRNLEAEEARVASTEQRAAQLWDVGQPDAAEKMLRDACNEESLSSSSKVGLVLWCFDA